MATAGCMEELRPYLEGIPSEFIPQKVITTLGMQLDSREHDVSHLAESLLKYDNNEIKVFAKRSHPFLTCCLEGKAQVMAYPHTGMACVCPTLNSVFFMENHMRLHQTLLHRAQTNKHQGKLTECVLQEYMKCPSNNVFSIWKAVQEVNLAAAKVLCNHLQDILDRYGHRKEERTIPLPCHYPSPTAPTDSYPNTPQFVVLQPAVPSDHHAQGHHLQGQYIQGQHMQGHIQGQHLQGHHLQGQHLQGQPFQGQYTQSGVLPSFPKTFALTKPEPMDIQHNHHTTANGNHHATANGLDRLPNGNHHITANHVNVLNHQATVHYPVNLRGPEMRVPLRPVKKESEQEIIDSSPFAEPNRSEKAMMPDAYYKTYPLKSDRKSVQRSSVPDDIKCSELKHVQRPVRVLIVFADESRKHVDRVVRVAECVKKNKFGVTIDMPNSVFKSKEEAEQFLDTRYNKADFILICISSKLGCFFDGDIPEDIKTQYHTHFLVQKVKQEIRLNRKQRFISVLFADTEVNCIPRMLRHCQWYRWPERYNDLLFKISKPADLYKQEL